jgi:hypothetical protein
MKFPSFFKEVRLILIDFGKHAFKIYPHEEPKIDVWGDRTISKYLPKDRSIKRRAPDPFYDLIL